MDLQFKVINQVIYRPDSNIPASDSIGYLYAKFTFTQDWDGLKKTAIFKSPTNECYSVILIDDECLVPHETIKFGDLKVSVRGDDPIDNTTLITTIPFPVPIKQAGPIIGEVPRPPTPDEYAQVIEIMEQQAIDASRAEAAALEAESYAKFGTFSLVGNMLVATVEAADDITDIKINEEGKLVITIGD